ncbi:MAG: YrdB family protein [Bacteroides sp.]|nr:YrdB family protein [Bacteroides sp.]
MNKLNLLLRFLLEVGAIVSFGIWGSSLTDSGFRYVLAILFSMLFAVLWGVFAVKDDPSRSGKTVIQTPGAIRLFLELLLFGAATCMLFHLGYPILGWTLGAATVFHYIISFKRILWLLKQK